jgi:hypothetical protein
MDQNAAQEQARQTGHQKRGLLSRIMNLLRSYRLRQIIFNPLVWVEVVALVTVICYTRYAGQQADAAIKAANAAKRAADTAACALKDSEASFAQTVRQMESQTKAQQDSATAAGKAAKATADQVKELQAGVVQTSRLATTAESANADTRGAMETQTRPWIGIDGDPLDIEPNGPGIRFKLRLINYGQSPAVGVANSPSFALVHSKDYSSRLFDRYNICPQTSKVTDDVQRRGNVDIVFPGVNGIITQNVWAQATELSNPTNYNILIGCIVYRGPLGGPYYSRVIYGISEYITGLSPFRPPQDQKVTIRVRAFYDVQ